MKPLTPIKSIRAKCLECAGGKPSLIKMCDSENCALYFYRSGKNPNRAGIGGGKRGSLPENRHSSGVVHAGKKKSVAEVSPASLLGPGVSGEEIRPIKIEGQIDLETKGEFRIKKLNNGKVIIILKSES